MKLDSNVLVEIMRILQDGLLNGEDISQKLRDLDLVEGYNQTLRLSEEYVESQKE